MAIEAVFVIADEPEKRARGGWTIMNGLSLIGAVLVGLSMRARK